MGDEVQAGVCAENWWTMNLSQNGFGSSFCSPINMEIFSWPSDFDTKTRTSDESGSANSEGSIVFQDTQKPINQDSVGLSSSITTDWYQTLLNDSKRNLSNCESLNSSSNYQQDASTVDYSQVKKDWSLENFYTLDEDSCVDKFKGPIDVHGFPLSSSSYSYPSSLIQTLFDSDSDQETAFGNRSMDYPAISNICEEKLNEFSSSSFLKPNSVVLPKQQPLISHSPLPNNLAWNTCSDGFSTPVQSQFLSPRFENQLNCSNSNVKSNKERIQDMATLMKSNNNTSEPELKRTRIETPSPLPTFKVRKEKLGDRVTALQQLVSPFGKTDTASVLHEAIEYIKLLHDQVTVLIAPYMKGGSPILREQTRKDPKGADEGVIISQELRGRGLCVVPISSTFPVAAETTADYWMPTFGGSFR